jgi:hypothetical protein
MSTGPPQDYADYLIKIQERNRVMKKLNEKNPEKLEMEKKEQGFSLYLNGENAKKRKGPVKSDKLRKSTSYDTKQDTSVQRHQDNLQDDFIDDNKEDIDIRTETSQRRGWSQSAVRIKTSSGERLSLQAPERLTGDYESDFETTLNESSMPVDYGKNAAGKDSEELEDFGTDRPSCSHEQENAIMEFSSAPCLHSAALLSSNKQEDVPHSPPANRRPLTVGTSLKERTIHLRQNSAPLHGTRSLKSVSHRQTSLNDSLEIDVTDLMRAVEEENMRLSANRQSQDVEVFDQSHVHQSESSSVLDDTLKAADVLEETLRGTDSLLPRPQNISKTPLLSDDPRRSSSYDQNSTTPVSHIIGTTPATNSMGITPATNSVGITPGTHRNDKLLRPTLLEETCGLRILSSPPPESVCADLREGPHQTMTDTPEVSLPNQDHPLADGEKDGWGGDCVLDSSVLKRDHPQAMLDQGSPSLVRKLQDSRSKGKERASVPKWLQTSTRSSKPSSPLDGASSSSVIRDVFSDGNPPHSRPCSGRVSGLRGEMLRTSSAEPRTRLTSHEDSSTTSRQLSSRGLPTCEPGVELGSYTSQNRVKTAVLAQGRRPILLSSTSDPLLPPSVDDTPLSPPVDDTPLSPSVDDTPLSPSVDSPLVSIMYEGRRPQPVQVKSDILSIEVEKDHSQLNTPPSLSTDVPKNPVESESGPQMSIKNRRSWDAVDRRSIEECLASLSKFDSHHLGGITNIVDQDQDEDEGTASEDVTEIPQFAIPILPVGKELVVNILSTWGDSYYVGLSGIEIFTVNGCRAAVAEIRADPADINVLPEYDNDPRIAANLLDGVNRTRDDLHMWLAPFTKKANHFIYLTLQQKSVISMIRIWVRPCHYKYFNVPPPHCVLFDSPL